MAGSQESKEVTPTSTESLPTEAKIRFQCLLRLANAQVGGKIFGKGEMSPGQLSDEMYNTLKEAKNREYEKSPSGGTLREWIVKAAENNHSELARLKGIKVELFAEYLRLRHQLMVTQVAKELEFERINRASPDGELAYQMARAFSADTGGYGYAAVGNFDGTFACYRRAWAAGYPDHFQRSRIKIYFDTKWTIEEMQDVSLGGHAVDELNKGPILPFGSNFFATMRSEAVLKFLGISGFYPEPGTDRTVQLFFGHGQGMSGKGPHPGYPYVCSRIDGRMVIGDKGKEPSEYEHLEKTLVMHEDVWDRIPTTTDRALLMAGQELTSDLPETIRDDPHAEQSLRLLRRLERARLNDRM
ncbi:hypothetical protein KZZ07_21680 [Mameliella sp. CS4]|uniref:hypothetical protein n=1 Tax=Mameliella sp. CS4 TaxID=2862329 RepID=UPI001C5E11C9|nr:hypothetical protein [Mameliella sp. CS4]MBW4985158.1 hypothetical protein [Mameliella sp. CS4]